METLPISLPFFDESNASVRVFIIPEKEYGGVSGLNLLEHYASKIREPPKPKSLSSYQFNISESCIEDVEGLLEYARPVIFLIYLSKKLPDTIRLFGNDYDLRAICRIIEVIRGIKLISIRDGRPLRSSTNSCIEVKGYISDSMLVICGRKSKVYLLGK
jgi:hypothetical protein